MEAPIITKLDAEQQAKRTARWTLIGCSALVFITSVCIMVLELCASRLIAKSVGSSLYTWTSVIGVILAGISIGNFLGGWLADRFNHRKTLCWLFFISSVCCLTIYPLSQLMAASGRPDWLSWPVWVVIVVSVLFLHPSVVLGMISPVTASMALAKSKSLGSTVGNVYAWGAMGSIFGTFLAGFYLISSFGTQNIVWMTAATLALMGVLVGSGQWMFRGAMLFGWLQFVLWIGLFASARAPEVAAADRKWVQDLLENCHEIGLGLNLRRDEITEYNVESNYFYINVANRHENGDTVKALHLDHLTHSYYNPFKPTALYYDYERVYAAVTERAAETWKREATVPLTAFPGDPKNLPDWARYDLTARTLSTRGAITPAKRDELLEVSESAQFWKAVETLTSPENMALMSGLSSQELEEMPTGVAIPDELSQKIRFDETLGSLLRYSNLTASERETLLNLGPDKDYRGTIEELYGKSRKTSTLFIGGGGFVFPRWIEALFPYQPLIQVLELDPAVKNAVQAQMGLPADDQTFVKTIIGDARNSVDDLLAGQHKFAGTPGKHNTYDFVYGDAFNDFSVPWHLTTREFCEKIKQLMTPEEGVFLVNIIDIYPRAVAPLQVAAGTGYVKEVVARLPAEVWKPGKSAATQTWYPVPDKAKFGDVDIYAEPAGNLFQLRANSAITDEQEAAWNTLLNPDDEESTLQQPSPETDSRQISLLDAIAELTEQSNRRPVYTGELPATIVPSGLTENTWVTGLPPYDFLELKLRSTPAGTKLPTPKSRSYVIGFRGVMNKDTLEGLQKIAERDPELVKLFAELATQSRNAKAGKFLGAYVNTACQVFPYVYVFSANQGLPSDTRDTFVVACSLKKLDFDNLIDSGDHWDTPPFAQMESNSKSGRLYSTQMTSILQLARGMTLTDDYAPVDNLLIPVFADQ